MNQEDHLKLKIKFLEEQGYLQRASALRVMLKEIKDKQNEHNNKRDNDNNPSS